MHSDTQFCPFLSCIGAHEVLIVYEIQNFAESWQQTRKFVCCCINGNSTSAISVCKGAVLKKWLVVLQGNIGFHVWKSLSLPVARIMQNRAHVQQIQSSPD